MGGKDSTAMLITILESHLLLDEILYVDVGDWMWESAKPHIKHMEENFGVDITILDATEKLEKGFQRWGFPSFFNRWCTGVKRDMMRDYLKSKYTNEEIVQYIGYCSDEEKRISKKLYSSFETKYPLVEFNITSEDAFELCKEYGIDFGGVYEHHSHFNCWLCPLQRKSELQWIFENDKEKWEKLREMQFNCYGSYFPNETLFDVEKGFWKKHHTELREKMLEARNKFNQGERKKGEMND